MYEVFGKEDMFEIYFANLNTSKFVEKEGAKEFSSVNEFTKWYKDRAVEIIKEIKMDEDVQDYIRNSRKK